MNLSRPRHFHSLTAALACLLTASAALAGDPEQPNVILIMADDIGFECFSTYGGESYATPRLDELAATGMQFDHCYSQPICSPTRVQILTGKYNFRNYTEWALLADDEVTFAEVLRDAGYATAVAGKWQLYQGEPDDGSPVEAGFDDYCLWNYIAGGSRYWDPTIWINDVVVDTGPDDFGPDIFRDFILGFIEEHQSEPFLVYYPMALVHSPFVNTPDSPPSTDSVPERFNDMVEYMDKIVGQILDKLDELGLAENTIVMFTGDNGTSRSINSQWMGQILPGRKAYTEDLGTHVPLYVNWEGHTPDGARSDDLVDFTDMLATLADAAGAPLPPGETIDGHSFFPQLQGRAGTPREWVFCWYNAMHGGWPFQQFARTQRWKLYDDGRLFDITNDLRETNPIVVDTTQEMADARALLRAVLLDLGEPPTADINGDWQVDVFDLLAILNAWGECDDCPEDFNNDGRVDVSDLLALLLAWS